MIDELSMHICDTPNYTDGPCYACAKEKDADHFMLILNLLKTPLHASQKLNHFAKQNLEWANRCAELTSELSTLRGARDDN